ncbi:30S ribosomal protein S20 [bacterium]|nr:30S ribosomal protein S20 [bacterium]|tara:strand:- start:361 stop:633 length:273 start_codon:yes stop_codon:yes gene_type:complete
MPQLKAAKKALRQSRRRRVVNDRWRDKVRSSIRAVKDAVSAGDTDKAVAAAKSAQSVFDRAVRRNIINKNVAARKKAQLTKSATTIEAAK